MLVIGRTQYFHGLINSPDFFAQQINWKLNKYISTSWEHQLTRDCFDISFEIKDILIYMKHYIF